MKSCTTILLALTAIISFAQEVEDEPEQIDCRGTITSFEKEGFGAWNVEGGHEVYDVTWVSVTFPKEYEGIRQMLWSGPGDQKSPFGNVGDEIEFIAYKATLDSEKQSRTNHRSQRGAGAPRG